MQMNSPLDTSKTALRIVDANLNRIGESLRLLEDIARLLLNDAVLSGRLKAMRHELAVKDLRAKKQLLQSRDSRDDVGIDIEVKQQTKERELPAAVIANARRIQEAMRVIEELAKIPGTGMDSGKFKDARFEMYDIERELVSRILRNDKTKRMSGLYAIIDTQYLGSRSCDDLTQQVLEGGAKIVQLRHKDKPERKLLNTAKNMKTLCSEYDALFIMNDRLDIALAADADGLHIGQDDMPLRDARRLLPLDKIIGCSVDNIEQANEAEAAGADYIAFGAIFPTQSKNDIETVGLKALAEIKKATGLPLVAIGGINAKNAPDAITAGADSVAVISAIMQAESPKEATMRIISKLETQN